LDSNAKKAKFFEYEVWCWIAALNPSDVRDCMGDLEADKENPILQGEQEAQVCWLSSMKILYMWKLCVVIKRKCLMHHKISNIIMTMHLSQSQKNVVQVRTLKELP